MGNICRSPTAEGVFSNLLRERGLGGAIRVDSAGTHAYHVDEPPDERAQAAALEREIDLSGQRARQVERADFERYDYIVAMDRDNLSNLRYLCPEEYREKIHLFMDFALKSRVRDVPDPYYGGGNGFERVLDLVEEASQGLLEELQGQD